MGSWLLCQLRQRDVGRQVGGWNGLPGELRLAGPFLSYELDAVHYTDFGSYVRSPRSSAFAGFGLINAGSWTRCNG